MTPIHPGDSLSQSTANVQVIRADAFGSSIQDDRLAVEEPLEISIAYGPAAARQRGLYRGCVKRVELVKLVEIVYPYNDRYSRLTNLTKLVPPSGVRLFTQPSGVEPNPLATTLPVKTARSLLPLVVNGSKLRAPARLQKKQLKSRLST